VDNGNPPHYDPAGQGYDPGDLRPHGIFPTYFKEFKVVFDSAYQTTPYDTAARAQAGTVIQIGGTGMTPDVNSGHETFLTRQLG